MAEVVLQNLTKHFGRTVAVDRVDLHVPNGELLVLVGPSGCGKTTILRMIAGLEDVTAGTIRIGDRDVQRLAPRDRDVAMVFQHGALYPHLNVYQNLAFGLKLRRLARTEIDRRVRHVAEILGVAELLDRRPEQLSGGQRQRIAVGRGLVQRPALFLLDEPLSDLDAPSRASLRAELVRLQRQLGTTTIHVTHDQTESLLLGDRVAVMHAGRIPQVGQPLDLYDAPANRFVAEFIGSPPMNLWTGTIAFAAGSLVVVCRCFTIPLPPTRLAALQPWQGREVLVGLRPEHLLPAPTATATCRVPAEVTSVQRLGSETIVGLRCGDLALAARTDPHATYQRAQSVDFHINTARVHLFDPVSGQAI